MVIDARKKCKIHYYYLPPDGGYRSDWLFELAVTAYNTHAVVNQYDNNIVLGTTRA